MTQIQDVRLVIKIENKEPIELFDLTKSLVSLATQFNSYVDKHGDTKENKEAKLYVKEIKSGSVIFELVEYATAGLIPFVDNFNTIMGFTKYLKSIFDFFLKQEGEKPEISPSDYKELSAIINPVAKDSGSQYNISTVVNGNVELHFHVNAVESNAMQNMFKSEIEKSKLPDQIDEVKQSVLLTWFQARNDLNSKIGNKGVIEDLSEKALNITFDSEELKEKMLHSDINPFNMVYVVDVKIQTVQDKPVAYKVVKLHEYFDANEAENSNIA